MSLSEMINAPAAPAAPATPAAASNDFTFAGDEAAPADDSFSFDKPAAKEEPVADEVDTEEPSPEEVEGEDELEAAADDALEEEAAEAVDEPLDLAADPEAKIKLGDEVLTAKEVKDRLLMREDYTRKTQAISAERKVHADAKMDHDLYKLQVEDLLTVFEDPSATILEMSSHKPEVWREIEKRIVNRYIRLADMTDGERAMFFKNEEYELAKHVDKREQERTKKVETAKDRAHKSAELVKSYNNWRTESMRAVGLNVDKAEHLEAVTNAMVARHRGKAWSKELFDAECARVAKSYGVKPPKAPPKKEAAPAAPAAKKPALPPVKGRGNARPATPGAAPKSKPKTIGNEFHALRTKYGVR